MSDDKKAIDVLPGHMSVSAVRVERNLFFRRPQAATHRYTEHSPPVCTSMDTTVATARRT